MGVQSDRAQRDEATFYARRFRAAEEAGNAAKAEMLAMEWLRADRDNGKPYRKLALLKLARGDAPGALEIAARGAARIPSDVDLLALAGKLCERLGDHEGAMRYLQQRAEIPDQRRDALVRIARLYLLSNETDQARDAFAEAVDLGEPEDTLGAQLAELEQREPLAAANYQEAVKARAASDLVGALQHAEAGLAASPHDAGLLRLAAKLAAALGDTEQAVQFCLRRAQLPGQRRHSLLTAARLQLQVADTIGARASLEAATAAGVAKQKTRLLWVKLAILERDSETGLALLDEEESETGNTPQLQTLRKKLQKRARAKVRAADAIVLKSAATSELRAWAANADVPTQSLDTAAQKLITPLGDIMLERAPTARAIVLVFGGLATMFGGGAEDLGFLVSKRKLNALFLSDPQRLFLLNGLASVGDYAATIAWIKELSQAWSAPNLYCIGFSGGGYPAIRYGADIGARRVLTFAAPTQITPGITQIDTRATALAHRVLTRKPEMCVNLRDYLAGLGAAAPEIINYYGELVPEDAYHARNLAGLPNVSCRPLAELDSHGDVVTNLKKDGRYKQALEELLRDCDG